MFSKIYFENSGKIEISASTSTEETDIFFPFFKPLEKKRQKKVLYISNMRQQLAQNFNC